MSGGKGGGQSTKTEIPVWAEEATKRNLARAEDVQRIGYMPYYGPDVAAFNPTQQLAMQNNMDAAAAFGLASPGQDAMAGMPRATDYNGIQGYSSGGLYDQAVAEFERNKPGYAREYNALFAKNSSSDEPSYLGPWDQNFSTGRMSDLNIPAGAGQQFPENVMPNINVMDNYGKNMTSMPKMPDFNFSITPPNSDLSMTPPSQIPLTSMPQMPQISQLPAQLPQLPAQMPQMPAQMPQMPYQTQPAAGPLGSGIGTSVNAGPIPTGRGVADGVQMPSQDYMRMLRDFQTQGGSVGENATKKLAEAQAIIDANQSQPQMPQLTALPIPAAMPEQNIDEMMKGLRNTRSIF